MLAREGRIGRELFLILTGSVAVTQQGRRVNTLGAGDFFGELAAMDPGPRNATVTALSDLDVLIIGPREFSAMADIPGFRDALFRTLASRLRTAEARLAAALDAPDRGRHRGKVATPRLWSRALVSFGRSGAPGSRTPPGGPAQRIP